MPQTILIVHDDAEAAAELGRVVTTLGYDVKTATDGNELIESVDANSPVAVDLLLTVLSFDIVESLAYLGDVAQKRPEVPVIVLSHDGDDAVVGQAIKAGATDVLLIPVGPERLRISIQNALKLNSLSGQVSRLSRRYEGEMGFQDLIGQSPGMRRVGDLASRAAASNISILIEGESGVGKEMVARAIQGESDRAGKPFVAVNCGAIPENLVESILFGHEKGAFTGANTRHIGKFQEADGGTLFLDEIGELRPDVQVKLLRALQEGEIDAVGGKKPVKVDIRLISATNRNLVDLVEEGSFREDLYYRLNVFPVLVPPLRERHEDILPLVNHFIAMFSASERKDVRGADEVTMQQLTQFAWPGNVRQLENMIYRAVVLADGVYLTIADFPQLVPTANAERQLVPKTEKSIEAVPTAAATRPIAPEGDVQAFDTGGDIRRLDAIEADVIRAALTLYRGQMSEVARRLGIGRSTLYRKVREYEIDDGEAKAPAEIAT